MAPSRHDAPRRLRHPAGSPLRGRSGAVTSKLPPPGPAHRYPLRVYFEDTDAGGMAYHANYLRWAERARTESLRAIGLPHQMMIELHDSILVVRRIEVEYWRPARLDDAIVVETRVVAVRGVTLVLDQRMLREGEGVGEGPLAALRVELACVDRHGLRPKRIPEPWRSALSGSATG
nr:YbgC/FadM family acyl-CoA thioesterase [Siccirubricoccus soli]